MDGAPEPVPSTNHEGTECVLTLGDLRELVQELEPIKEWFTLGLYLGLKDDKLREIDADHHHLQRRKSEVLSRWLRKGHDCTWRRVVEVLTQMGEMVVADTIKLKYLTLSTEPQTASVPTNPVADAAAQRNLIVIRGKWGDLVAHTDEVLQDKLDNREITSNRFRHVLGNLYSCEGKMNGDQFLRKLLKPSATISEMFETLTMEGAWDYLNYYPLECIIEKFGNDSTRKMMEQYKRDLTGYTLMTAIKDHLDAVDMEHPTHRILPIPQEKLFFILSCKVKANITNHSLRYVRDVWRSLAERFQLPMPALLLHKIAKGCLEITWCSPAELAPYVIRKAKQSADYFKEQHFLQVSVDSVSVYTERKVEVSVEVLHEESMFTEGGVGMEEMRWETLGRAPEMMMQGATAVDGNTVYITPAGSHHVWAYEPKEDKWTGLPDCPQRDAGLAIVSGLLTAVGGRTDDGDVTNTLVSLTESCSDWTEHFPPMPMELYDPAVVCTSNHLLVTEMGEIIYVMDTTSLQWFSAGSLALPSPIPSLAVCGTELYVLDSIGSVFSCSLPTLLQTSSAVQPETTDVWQRLADIPVSDSTITTLCGQLVAVGGYDPRSIFSTHLNPTDTLHQYDILTDTWHVIRHIPTARYKCLVATLPDDTLVVIGGITTEQCFDVVEVAYPV